MHADIPTKIDASHAIAQNKIMIITSALLAANPMRKFWNRFSFYRL
jgi:hypothetical protein